MRTFRLFVFATAILTAIYLGRHHLAELSRTLETYVLFNAHLTSHPEEIYRYGNSTEPKQCSRLVSPIIHQIYLTNGRNTSPTKYDTATRSCKRLHHDWEYMLWTDEPAAAFMQQHYPQLWPHYMSYRRTVQRANILRYALLDHYGGIYLDLDLTCLEPLDSMMHLPFLGPAAHPSGISNGFMMSRPRHPFLKQVLATAPASDLSWGLPYVETMLSTGCMFLSNQFMKYTRSLSTSAIGASDSPKYEVFVLADERGHTGPHMLRGIATTPLFHHGGTSSWHEWDASVFVLIGEHYFYFLTMISIGAVFSALMIWRHRVGRHYQRDRCCNAQREKAGGSGFKDECSMA